MPAPSGMAGSGVAAERGIKFPITIRTVILSKDFSLFAIILPEK